MNGTVVVTQETTTGSTSQPTQLGIPQSFLFSDSEGGVEVDELLRVALFILLQQRLQTLLDSITVLHFVIEGTPIMQK